MKTTAVILFAGIAAAQRDQVMRKDFNQDRFMPEMMGGDQPGMPGPRPFGKPSGSRGGGSRREPFGGRRGRGNRPRGPGKPHYPPRGLDNFDADNFDRMQERVYDDLEKKTEKKMNKLTKLCNFMGEEDQENCMGWAQAEVISSGLIGTCNIEFDTMLSLCNNSLRKTAKSYKPKKNMGNKDIDLDSEEELDFEVLLEAEEETSELIEYQEFTTNEDIGQCFTDSLSSLQECMLEATEDATEALGSFTKPSEDELDDIKQQLRQEKMQKMMEKQRQSRWGNNNRGFDQGFGNFGMPERFNSYDKRGNYGPKDSRFNQAPDFDMRDMYYGNGRY